MLEIVIKKEVVCWTIFIIAILAFASPIIAMLLVDWWKKRNE